MKSYYEIKRFLNKTITAQVDKVRYLIKVFFLELTVIYSIK